MLDLQKEIKEILLSDCKICTHCFLKENPGECGWAKSKTINRKTAEFSALFDRAIKKGKWVQLAEDQSLPEPSYSDDKELDPAWVEQAVMNDMLNAGFRRIKGLTLQEAVDWFEKNKG